MKIEQLHRLISPSLCKHQGADDGQEQDDGNKFEHKAVVGQKRHAHSLDVTGSLTGKDLPLGFYTEQCQGGKKQCSS